MSAPSHPVPSAGRAGRAWPAALPLVLAAAALLAPAPRAGDVLEVSRVQKISNLAGGFGGNLLSVEQFGIAAEAIGDLDGDGISEVAVGQPRHEDFGLNGFGSVWILFLDADGTVRDEVEIMSGVNGFGAVLEDGDQFGVGIAALGDIDGDGLGDIAVGAKDDGPGFGHGGLYVLRLNADGTVKAWNHVTNGTAGLSLDNSDGFGIDLEGLGDLDGDGVEDLVVGAWFDGDGNFGAGALYVLFLNADGTVKSWQKISSFFGGLGFTPASQERFGRSVANLGDLDGDGVVDLAVGTLFGTESDATKSGAIYVLFLNSNGTVKATQKISEGVGGFTGALDVNDSFGASVEGLGDLDGDGVTELAVGATGDDEADSDAGAVWILSLTTAGTVSDHAKVTSGQLGFGETLGPFGGFGSAVARLDDIDADGQPELMVGASLASEPTSNSGAVFTCFLRGARFTRIPGGVPGVAGLPTLTAAGALAGGDPVSLNLAGARPSAPCLLIVSFDAALTPLNGGTLVPVADPPAKIVLLMTDATGSIVIPSTWPVGLPVGQSIWMQYWIQDPAAPFGWSATDGLLAVQPKEEA